jgi:hypothetical protein
METPRNEANPSILRPMTTSLALLAGLMRLVPHPHNFTPVGALGLFSGARLQSWYAFAVPIAVMVLSDMVLQVFWNYPPFDPFVYGSILLNVLLGRWLCRNGSAGQVGFATVLASGQFFLVTNFGAWLQLSSPAFGTYTRDLSGLMASYAAAIPFMNTEAPPLGFFGNMLLGDVTFVIVLIGLHAVLSRWAFPRERVICSERAVA